VEPQATGRASHPPAPHGFQRIWIGGLLLCAVVALTSVGLEASSSWPYLTPLGAMLGSLVVLLLRGVPIRSLGAGVRPWSVQAAAALAVAVALLAALAGVPGVVRSGYRSLTGPSYPLARADLVPLSGYASIAALAAAARLIPAGETFSVVYGNQYPIPLLFQFWLMPTRAFTWDTTAASWVIVYDEPLPAGLRFHRKVALAPGVYAVEVTH